MRVHSYSYLAEIKSKTVLKVLYKKFAKITVKLNVKIQLKNK
jgi:hypothetical protein